MEQSNDLIVIEPSSVMTVFTTDNGLDPYLKKIEQEVTGIEADVTTDDGRKLIASTAYKVARTKTYLDGLGKDLTEEWAKKKARVDASRRQVRDFLDNLKDRVRAPLDSWEEAEAARAQRVKDVIVRLQVLGKLSDDAGNLLGSDRLKDALSEAQGIVVDESFGEFVANAEYVQKQTVDALTVGIAAATKREADARELAALRQQQIEQIKRDREEQLRREGEERARRESEERRERESREAQAREAKLQREAKEAKERAALAEQEGREKAEREAKAKESRERQEAEVREANTRHRNAVHKKAVAALVAGGVGQAEAIKAVGLIAEGKVPAVKIAY